MATLVAFFILQSSLLAKKIIIIPGLNLRPQKLKELSKEFEPEFETIILDINYNIQRQSEIINNISSELSKSAGSVYFLAQSMGALYASFFTDNPKVKGSIYISPAFYLNTSGKLFCWFNDFNFFDSYKSFNYPEYRQNDHTTAMAYRNLCELSRSFSPSGNDSLIFASIDDELVDVKELQRYFKVNLLRKAPRNKYHHLLVDRFSIHNKDYKIMIEKIKAYLHSKEEKGQ